MQSFLWKKFFDFVGKAMMICVVIVAQNCVQSIRQNWSKFNIHRKYLFHKLCKQTMFLSDEKRRRDGKKSITTTTIDRLFSGVFFLSLFLSLYFLWFLFRRCNQKRFSSSMVWLLHIFLVFCGRKHECVRFCIFVCNSLTNCIQLQYLAVHC